MTLKTRSVAAALSAALAFSLAGCGGGAEAKTDPPPLPAAAAKHDDAGGKAFIQHYFDLTNYAFTTGDPTELAKLSAPTCVACRQTIGDVAYAYTFGVARGGKATIKKIDRVKQVPDRFVMVYDVQKYEEVTSDGKVRAAQKAKADAVLLVQLQWKNGAWRLGELARFPELDESKKGKKDEKDEE